MDWIQVFTILAANATMFFWARSESRADIRHMDNKMEATRELVRAIHAEVRDFHARLCAIEERGKK